MQTHTSRPSSSASSTYARPNADAHGDPERHFMRAERYDSEPEADSTYKGRRDPFNAYCQRDPRDAKKADDLLTGIPGTRAYRTAQNESSGRKAASEAALPIAPGTVIGHCGDEVYIAGPLIGRDEDLDRAQLLAVRILRSDLRDGAVIIRSGAGYTVQALRLRKGGDVDVLANRLARFLKEIAPNKAGKNVLLWMGADGIAIPSHSSTVNPEDTVRAIRTVSPDVYEREIAATNTKSGREEVVGQIQLTLFQELVKSKARAHLVRQREGMTRLIESAGDSGRHAEIATRLRTAWPYIRTLKELRGSILASQLLEKIPEWALADDISHLRKKALAVIARIDAATLAYMHTVGQGSEGLEMLGFTLHEMCDADFELDDHALAEQAGKKGQLLEARVTEFELGVLTQEVPDSALNSFVLQVQKDLGVATGRETVLARILRDTEDTELAEAICLAKGMLLLSVLAFMGGPFGLMAAAIIAGNTLRTITNGLEQSLNDYHIDIETNALPGSVVDGLVSSGIGALTYAAGSAIAPAGLGAPKDLKMAKKLKFLFSVSVQKANLAGMFMTKQDRESKR